MTVKELEKKQEELQDKILQHAEDNGLVNTKIGPICDGVADIEKYLSSSPKIMWILKDPYEAFTKSGEPKGGGWYLTKYFKDEGVWKNLDMWKLMIKVNFGIRNNLNWDDMSSIKDNPKMTEELKKMAYINVGKMPYYKKSSNSHVKACYNLWKDILFEQIELYKPDVIVFGYTFKFFKRDLQIADKPLSYRSGKFSVNAYKKDGMILIDAYHPSRKGGEYVTNIINVYRAVSKN